MIEKAYKDEYWSVVEECLEIIHGVTRPEAHRMSASLRKRIERSRKDRAGDLFYHNEPYNVACDLAGNEPAEDDVIRSKYGRILDSHDWLPAKD